MAENKGNNQEYTFETNSTIVDETPSTPINKLAPKQNNNQNTSQNQGGTKH